MPDSPPSTLVAEDAKLVTLARAARARIGAIEGAAVRDQDGRTYAAATVALPSLGLSALPPQVRFLLMKKKAVTMPIDSTRKAVEIALTSGVTVRRSWPSM